MLLFFPEKAQAAFSFNIASSSATTITSGGQEVEVNLNVTSLPSESYFRVSLQKEGGGSYFGYVLNGVGDWAKILTLSGDCSAYYRIADTSITSLTLKYKVGDDTDISNGNYNLKAHRFTKTCTSYTEATNSLAFTVNLPTPTPDPTITPVPSPTPTAVPPPTPTPTKTPTPIPSKSPSPTPLITPTPTDSLLPEVLGDSTVNLPTPTLVVEPSQITKPPVIALVLVGTGVLFIGLSAYMAFKKTREQRKENEA